MTARNLKPIAFFMILIVAALACSMPIGSNTPASPAVDATKVALEIFATQNAAKPTEAVDATKVALEVLATQNAPKPTLAVDATKVALEVMATNASMQLTQQAEQVQPTVEAPPAETKLPEPPAATPTEDFAARMKTANILVYEDTPNIGMWITEALNGLDVKYVHVGDAIGHLMENLNSPIEWDLIIIGAEARTRVQGEFWEVINEKIVKNKTALIAEVWYLDKLGNGKIKQVMNTCGIEYQSDWDLADSIYWLDSSHPLFSDPNIVMPLLNYSRYWNINAGDLIRVSPGSRATMLAGLFQKQKSDYGVLATCLDGRVVFQTFSNHDYHEEDIVHLWQNYITYTLKNRFRAVP